MADPDPTEQVARAFAFVVRSAGTHPQTEAELAGKLRRREVPAAIAAEALARARGAGVVDDASFARAWVEDRGRRRGFGAARVRRELERRQVAPELVDDALRALDDRDDLAVATDLARRRAAQLPASLAPETVGRRLEAYLVRRGHPPGLARRAAIEASGLARDWD